MIYFILYLLTFNQSWATAPTSSTSSAHHSIAASIAPINTCNCYGVEYSETDCSEADPAIMQNISCDGNDEFINPFYVYSKKRDLPPACVGYLLEQASAQSTNLLQNFLTSENYRGVVELGGTLNVLRRNRLLETSSISILNSDNPCGVDTNVMRAAHTVSDILFMPAGELESLLTPALRQITLDSQIKAAEASHASKSSIKALHRQRDAVFLNEIGGTMATDYCNAVDSCKVMGGTQRTVDGFSFCQVDGIAYDPSCFDLPPILRANFMRNIRDTQNRGVSCLRGLNGSAATVGDALDNHFETSVGAGLPRTQICCGNNGCKGSNTTFGLGGRAHDSERLRSIGGISYGGSANHGAIVFSNSTIQSHDRSPTQGLMFHEFLHRLGACNSPLHNHQDRREMRPNASGACYPASDGVTSDIVFIAQDGRCVPDPASPNASCASAMTTLSTDQYDPIYACQTACFSERPSASGIEQERFDRSKELCRAFVGSNGLSSESQSTAIKGSFRRPDGTETLGTPCDFVAIPLTNTAPAPAGPPSPAEGSAP